LSFGSHCLEDDLRAVWRDHWNAIAWHDDVTRHRDSELKGRLSLPNRLASHHQSQTREREDPGDNPWSDGSPIWPSARRLTPNGDQRLAQPLELMSHVESVLPSLLAIFHEAFLDQTLQF
jgi:hypothetical protein